MARWITDPDNPLTLRVIANRLWLWHFGQGLVDTPSDFGAGGSQPSHPELLDWLASQLRVHRGSLKAMHRLILTSRTWQQASITDDATRAADPLNARLARAHPRRLTAEQLGPDDRQERGLVGRAWLPQQFLTAGN